MVLLLFCFIGCQSDLHELTWRGSTMGTTYQVKITGVDLSTEQYDNLHSEIETALKEINRQMSTYDPQSEISRFNSYHGTDPQPVSAQFAQVVKASNEISVKSDGAFDITVGPLVDLWGFGIKGKRTGIPSEKEIKASLKQIGFRNLHVVGDTLLKKDLPGLKIDLSAIAKGYGVDVIAGIIIKHGFENYLVEIGGEVMAYGINAHREPWKIGIDRPEYANLPGQQIEGVLALENAAVATSGDYRNFFDFEGKIYSHTIDPKSGWTVKHNLASATVIAQECMLADALATAVMALGPELGLRLIENLPGIEVLLILRMDNNDFSEQQSSGFAKYLHEHR